ncbi:hypothetical protein N9917_01155 [Deltaproteobacteria bacterium]|nr:hypothetical protein [Deltaproteobacteria bacterium]
MKITISKRDLEASIQIASIGVSAASADLSGHFLFRLRDGKAEVLAYNQRIFAGCPLTCQIEEGEDGDAFTVESWRLKQWLGAVADAALTLTADEATVTAQSPRGKVKWGSLDPNKFPYWDDILAGATEVADIDGERLHSAVAYAKQFVSPEENTAPHLAVTEIRQPTDKEGNDVGSPSLYATDQVGVAVIHIDGMDGSRLRLHGKDTAAVLSFLALKGSDKVKVKEHDRCLFIERTDGAIFGVARPNSKFPSLNVEDNADPEVWWILDVEELEGAIKFLGTSAAKDDTRIRFSFDADKKSVVVAVSSASGGEDSLPVKTIDFGGVDGLPDDGFLIRHPYLTKVTSQFASDTIRFDIFQKKKGGWVRFRHEKEGDKYLTVVVWVR